MFSDTVLYEAAHVIYANQFADALDAGADTSPAGKTFATTFPL